LVFFFPDKKEIEENPYEDPIDAVTTSEVHSATPLNDDYATIEEYRTNELRSIVVESPYEVLLVHNVPDMI
jgi:hypothetical protein